MISASRDRCQIRRAPFLNPQLAHAMSGCFDSFSDITIGHSFREKRGGWFRDRQISRERELDRCRAVLGGYH
jgi:hypothetical protein